MQGNRRVKTRAQAQDKLTFSQERFDGGLNVDVPASRIAPNESAELTNLVAFKEYPQGHTGKRLYSATARPGSGTIWSEEQHPVTRRVLMHRGSGLWLSSDAAMTSWTEVASIGPDGSLEAAGSLATGYDIAAPASTYLSGLTISGWSGTGTMSIEIGEDTPGSAYVRLILDGDTVAESIFAFADQPISGGSIAAQGGSGISGTVNMDGWTNQTADGTVTPGAFVDVVFALRGLTLENTDGYQLWWKVVVVGSDATLTLYKDAALTQSVAAGTFNPGSSSSIHFSPTDGSGLSGYSTWPISSYADGSYLGTTLVFSPVAISIDFESKIESYRDSGFIVFIRGSESHNVYVEQKIYGYWFLSTPYGYGDGYIISGSPDVYRYRYLYTYSRIVDFATGEPAYSSNRNSAILQLEGPSNPNGNSGLDYSERDTSAPISGSAPNVIPITESSGTSIGDNAASYITHISLYRTKDVGVNGVTADGLVNNPELYVWVADVPIYSTEYSDDTTDAVLQNRAQNQYQLKSRFFTEMAKGIGAVGPDFMYTAAPDTTRVTVCDAGLANPRFIGFYRPDIQFLDVKSPIVQILRPRNMFVIISKSYTMTSTSGIYDNGGSPLVGEFIPTVRDLEPSSETIGLTNPDSYCFLSETDFAGFCSDETVRIFSNGRWGDPIDANRVHSLIGVSQGGISMGYVRGALNVFFRYSAAGTAQDQCLRFGFGGFAGYNWSRITRDSWVHPPANLPLLRLIDDTGILRLLAIGEDGLTYAIEDDEDQRQWVDDVGVGTRALGAVAPRFTNLQINGYVGSYLYGYYQSGPSLTWNLFADAALTIPVGSFYLFAAPGTFSFTPAAGYETVSGSVTFDGDGSGPDGNLDVEIIAAVSVVGAAAGKFSSIVMAGLGFGTLFGYYQSGLAMQWMLFADAELTVLVGSFALSATPGRVQFVPAAGYEAVSGSVYYDGDDSFPDGNLDIVNAPAVQVEYPTLYRPRALEGTQFNHTVDHMESHIDIEEIPFTEIPDGFYMSARAFADGVAVPGAVVQECPYNGDIQFRARVEGRKIQVEYATNSARFRITGTNTEYAQRDMISPTGPSDTPEYVYQAELEAAFTQWISRPVMSLNGANGLPYIATGLSPEMVEDPTGSMFGLRFTSDQALAQEALTVLDGDYTVMGWFIPNEATPVLCNFAGTNPLILQASGSNLVAPNGDFIANVFTGDWKHVAIVRQAGVMSVYVNGALAATPIADATSYAGSVFDVGAYNFDLFDFRAYTNAKSYAAVTYYVNDILTNRGRKVLSVFN